MLPSESVTHAYIPEPLHTQLIDNGLPSTIALADAIIMQVSPHDRVSAGPFRQRSQGGTKLYRDKGFQSPYTDSHGKTKTCTPGGWGGETTDDDS
jgi:hypothetical protein